MLARTPYTLALLRSAQLASDEKVRRQHAEASKPKPQKLNRQRFRSLVDNTARILKAGEPTRFEFEGACRHGIRSALCLDGWSWTDADVNAAEIVAAALNQIGAVRPTWQAGQPEYAIAYGSQRFYCERCGGKIPEDRTSSNGTPVKYCSSICRDVAYSVRSKRFGEQRSLAEWLAACAARSERTLKERARDCDHCGKPFLSRTIDRKYCSRKCFYAGEVKYQERPCDHCGTPFKPENTGKGISRFCSRECGAASRVKARPELQCATCQSIFRPKYPSDKRRYCSPACNPYAALVQSRWRCDPV